MVLAFLFGKQKLWLEIRANVGLVAGGFRFGISPAKNTSDSVEQKSFLPSLFLKKN